MLEALILKLGQPRCLTIALLAVAAALSSCASQSAPQTALVSDPDARPGSAIPWNKPANWEGKGEIPNSAGLSGGQDAFGSSGNGGTGGY